MRFLRTFFYVFISIPVYAVLYIVTAVTVLSCLLFSLIKLEKVQKACIWIWARSSFLIAITRLKISGKENFDKRRNYLMLVNHTSLFDIMAIMTINPGVSWFGREYLTKIPVFGYFLRTINYIPMKTASLRNTKSMLEKLVQNAEGFTIAMFPEGTRTTTGRLLDFKRGFIHVLNASDLDVLPITLNGTFDLKPKTRFSIKVGSSVEVVIHKPIANSDLRGKDDGEIIELVKNIIESGFSINRKGDGKS